MDCITIKNMTFRGLHGHFPEERRDGNDFEVDVTIWVPLQSASRDDELGQTIDYSHAAGLVREVMEGPSVRLIETLLYRIGEQLATTFPEAHEIEVAIRKLHPPMNPSCEYTEVRSRWPRQ
ncbi:dihydroneopterin aldolase [Balneolales bacterium ANBcel1]|nr:dihydroneopterin aldolase [Balneolales bacterium ANBcel1]